MKYRDPSTGQFNPLHVKVSDTLAIGIVLTYAGTNIPEGWLACDGSAVSRTAYSALFAAIGTTYGAGDGSTTFNLPDYRDRVPVGLDTNDSDFNILGKTLGEKTHTLTIDEMPSHTHGYYDYYGLPSEGGSVSRLGVAYNSYSIPAEQGVGTKTTGGGQAHNIIQPSIVTNYIIKAYQVVAAPAKVTNQYSESNKEVYSTNYVNDKLAGIIESGSNENGNWIKYVDGTMICYGLTSVTASDTRSAGGLSYYSGATTITLPQTFIDTNYRFQSTVDMANMNYFAQSYVAIISTSQIVVSFVSTGQNETRNVHWLTIGRWK